MTIAHPTPAALAEIVEKLLADYNAARSALEEIDRERVAAGAELTTVTDRMPDEREAAIDRLMQPTDEYPTGRSRSVAEKMLGTDAQYAFLRRSRDQADRQAKMWEYRQQSQYRKLDHLERSIDLALMRVRQAIIHETFNAKQGGIIA
jgi:chromosome segregation ATPase